ncbi:unnamed protein product [Rangifer tarandus platyrhynchus]|uniref:Uncharacterized protein n=1 Tax=Rangifer tarandus platyrhynchus TaxID=3082113 RepID=A0AC59ZCE2_RANTA
MQCLQGGAASVGSVSERFPQGLAPALSARHPTAPSSFLGRLPGQLCTSLRTASSSTSEGGSPASPNSDGPSATPLNPLSDDRTPPDKVHSSALGGGELCLGTSILALGKVPAPYTYNSCMLFKFF